MADLSKIKLPDNTTYDIKDETARIGIELLKSIHADNLTYAQIRSIVRTGYASEWFSIGDQIMTTWSNGTTSFDCPFDIVAFRDVYTENSASAVPGMILQMHYATIHNVQFDQTEAFYVLSDTLSAGTYYFTFGETFGSYLKSGDSYYFTTTQSYSAGAQFVLGVSSSDYGAFSKSASSWRVRTYGSSSDTSPTEILTVTSGTSGTSLGTLYLSTAYSETGLNSLQRCSLGYNRWSQSAARQYLNSSADSGSWWTPQNPFDRAPTQLSSLSGFMSGFESDFLGVLSPTKVTTALNQITDADIGTSEYTYDTFFLASLEEEYVEPMVEGVEGSYWPYWKTKLGLTSPQSLGSDGANPNHIRYSLSSNTAARHCRLRSASVSNAYNSFLAKTNGDVNGNYSINAQYMAPACVIC